MSKPKRSDTISTTADTFDIAIVTIRKWTRAGCPHDRRDGRLFFNPAEVAHWLREHPQYGHGPGRRQEPESAELQEVKLRKISALADMYEVRLALARGELMSVDDWERDAADWAESIKRPLLQLPATMAAQLAGLSAAEMEKLITERIEQILANQKRPHYGPPPNG